MLKRAFVLSLLMAVLILPVGAKACLVSVTITASDGTNTAIQTFSGESGCVLVNKDDPKTEIPILDGAITSLKLTGDSDPEVGIEFGVRAGNSTMTFTISDDSIYEGLSFALLNPTASASAGITLTDRNSDGATITGLFTGGKTNQASYNFIYDYNNNSVVAGSGSVFANLVSGFSIGSGQTSTNSTDTGSQIIPGTVSSIESEFKFMLSPRDGAAFTSTFSVVPEPATIGLLGLGTLSLLRRKR